MNYWKKNDGFTERERELRKTLSALASDGDGLYNDKFFMDVDEARKLDREDEFIKNRLGDELSEEDLAFVKRSINVLNTQRLNWKHIMLDFDVFLQKIFKERGADEICKGYMQACEEDKGDLYISGLIRSFDIRLVKHAKLHIESAMRQYQWAEQAKKLQSIF